MADEKIELFLEAQKDTAELSEVVSDLRQIILASKRTADGVNKQTERIDRGFKEIGRSITGIKRLIGGLAAAAGFTILAVKIQRIAEGAVDIAASFEALKISLDTITKGKGAEWFDRLNEWALKMPVNTQRAIQIFQQLRAMGLQPTIRDMTTLVDVTSALGGGVDTMEGIARALGQIVTKGRVSAEELMQLAERGVPAYEILRQKLGLSAEQVANIGNYAIDGRKAVQALLEGMAERFGGQSRKMMETWNGLMESLRSYYAEFVRQVMESGPFQFMRLQLKNLVDEIDRARADGRFQKWVQDMSRSILDAFKMGIDAANLFFDVAAEGFRYLSMIVRGWRELFASAVEFVAKGRLEALRGEREELQREIREIEEGKGFVARLRPESYTEEIRKRIKALDEEIASWELNRQAANMMLTENIAAQERLNRKIDETKAKLDSWSRKLQGMVDDAQKTAEAGAPAPTRMDMYVRMKNEQAKATEVMKAELRKRIEASLQADQKMLANVEKALARERQLYQEFSNEVQRIRRGMADDARRTEDMLRELARSGMSEEEQWYDRRAQAEERLAKARSAALKGDLELAKELARDAQQIAASLVQEVKAPEGETVIEKAVGVDEAREIVEEAGRIITEVWEDQKYAAERAVHDQARKMKPLEEAWGKLKGYLQDYRDMLEEIAKKDVPLRIRAENLEGIKREIEEMSRDRQMTLTIYKRVIETGSTGGLMGFFGAGGWTRIRGMLPGFGGGDIIRALLERGEYVINKHAVRTLGVGFFDFVNTNFQRIAAGFEIPRPKMAVPAMATGGPATGGPLMGRVELALPDGDAVTLLSTSEEARRLERFLERVRKTR